MEGGETRPSEGTAEGTAEQSSSAFSVNTTVLRPDLLGNITLDLHDENQAKSFESSSCEKVKLAIHTIQSQQEMTKTMMNMSRMEPFLTGMERFEQVLVAMRFEKTEKAMAYVWGPVQFLLETTMTTPKAFDNVLDAYEQLGNSIQLLEESMRLFTELPQSVECLTYIYQDVLTFHQHACRLFSLRTGLWQNLHMPAWKALKPTLEYLEYSLNQHKQFIQKHTTLCFPQTRLNENCEMTGVESSHDTSQYGSDNDIKFSRYCNEIYKYRDNFMREEGQRKKDVRNRVLAWISASKKMPLLHKKFQEIRICPDSGRFIFREYSEVTDWIREDQPPEPAIWLHGSKGFGKTVLASLLIDELKVLCTEAKRYTIPAKSKTYYFYCQEEDQCTFLDILKGLLHQMVEDNDDLLPLCADKVDSSGNTNLEDVELAKTLIKAFYEYNTRQYIIVDGLDECATRDEVCQTACFFMEQVIRCENQIKQGRLRVLFMSQPMPQLASDMPKDDACVGLRQKDNAGDIRSYVKERMQGFSKDLATSSGFNLSEQDTMQMENTICHQSEGMFLYAHLAIEYLSHQPNKEVLLEKIKYKLIPTGLSKIYEKLLGAVKEELLKLPEGEYHWQLAKLLLGWLVCAKRPLQWHEMQAILSFNTETQSVDFDTKMLRQKADKYLGSLVHILDGGHIRIIHSTARLFIVQNKHINEKEVQCQLATLCLEYLCLLSKSNDDNDDERKSKARRGWFSFQDYACSQWQSHIYTIITTCSDIFYQASPQSQKCRNAFGTALQRFAEMHHTDLPAQTLPGLETMPPGLTQLVGLPFYQNLIVLWSHIEAHQNSPSDMRNTVGIARLDDALQKSRETLEKHFRPSDITYIRDTIADYYGSNLFKCRRVLCQFFHLGYDNRKDRDAHHSRHERPFRCPHKCSSAPYGFSSKKDMDRHVRYYHPDCGGGPSIFEALQRTTAGRRFMCEICSRSFTRRDTLRGHERSHFGQRPYACSSCGKAFGRINDCRRHERTIHTRRRGR